MGGTLTWGRDKSFGQAGKGSIKYEVLWGWTMDAPKEGAGVLCHGTACEDVRDGLR